MTAIRNRVAHILLGRRLDYYAVPITGPDQWGKSHKFRTVQELYEQWVTGGG